MGEGVEQVSEFSHDFFNQN